MNSNAVVMKSFDEVVVPLVELDIIQTRSTLCILVFDIMEYVFIVRKLFRCGLSNSGLRACSTLEISIRMLTMLS